MSGDGRRTPSTAPVERERLSRSLIIDAAIGQVDRDGVSALSMRRLGKQLGVEAMSLYRYVNGREDLLEGIVDELVGELEVAPEKGLGASNGWQAYIQWLAHEVRSMALAHPAAFPLVATRHPAAPWLRPPLRSLRIVEQFLNALIDRGFTGEQAVDAYRTFTSFLLGHLLLETATLGAETGPASEPLDEGNADVPNRDEDVELADYPTLLRLRPLLSQDDTEAEFERALEALLDRLDMSLSQ
ncbi:MAG TPA: TetR/AcrR family transcriptional regulator C-terminal domain-containing protein [Intrasporangium sp.]|uniref:TetR/AcrR family transcriptional regulator n=1 Tax=Intrasporangium sp. TaxID=1925024 RepID=UPI002D77AB92|nr:TetR/AcrR family transcriptional regulator C-terminal domain-containing protein [Intrasporangium sp.]HET7397024.1 TetR/AcrR family transcriptional regulator C-terminal domain-containing protein [Intrasporangium sp.]